MSPATYLLCLGKVRRGESVAPKARSHEVLVLIQSRPLAHASVKNWQAAVDNSVKNGAKVEKLEKPEDFRAKAPVMTGALQ